jgi:hypothetical protein
MTKSKKVHGNNNDDNFDKEFEDLFGEDDFDGNFNDDDFLKESGDGRSAAEPGIAKELAKTAATSAGASFAKRLAKKTLPMEYEEYSSDAIGLVDFGKDVFDKSKEQLRRPIARFATEVKKLTPQSFTTVNKVLDKFIGEKEEGTQSQEQMQEAAIASSLSSIFDKQIEVQKSLEANRLAREDAEQKVEFKTQQRNSYYLSSIQAAAETQTNFTLNVAKDYYKKSLELQFRSYYAQTDLLRTTKDYFKAFSVQLDNITKNTSLPDALKIKSSERLVEEMKKKATSNIYGRFIDNNEYLNKVKDNISKMVQYKVSDIADKIDSLTSAISDVTSIGEMGGSTAELLASVGVDAAAGTGAEKLADKVAPRLRDRVRNNKYVKKGANALAAFGTSPQTFFQSLPGTFAQIKDTADSKTGPISSIVSALAGKAQDVSSVFDVSRADLRKTAKQDITTLREPAIFDQHYHRSVTQVIPLYLSHILRENTRQSEALMIKLTEEEKKQIPHVPLLSYDFNTNKLSETKELAASYGKFIKNKLGIHKVQSGAERITSAIHAAGSSINPMEREGFNKSIEKLSNSGFDMEKLDFDKIEEGSDLEKEIKGILGNNFNNFNTVVKAYSRVKDDKKVKLRQQLKEAREDMADKQLINILKRFMTSFSSLSFNTKDIKKYIDGFTNEELKNIAESILRSMIERSSNAMLPTKESIMSFLRYVKPLENKNKNKEFKQKIGLWVNLSDMAYINGDSDIRNILRKIYGELNTELGKIAQAVDAGFIRSLFDANPDLNIDPDKDVPDWRIIFQGDFMSSLNNPNEKFINTNDIPNKIGKNEKALLESIKVNRFSESLDRAEKAAQSFREKINALGGGAISNASKKVQKFFNASKDKATKALESFKNFRNDLANAKNDEERAKILIQASNSLAIASYEAAKAGISSFRSNIDNLGKQIRKGMTSDTAKKIMIGTIDGMINEVNKQIENATTRINELNELTKVATGISFSVNIELDDDEQVKPNDREQQEIEQKLKFTDYITRTEIESYKLQIEASVRGIKILKSFIKKLEEAKVEIATMTPETAPRVTEIIYERIRGIYESISDKVKDIEETYNREIEAIEQKQQKLAGNK